MDYSTAWILIAAVAANLAATAVVVFRLRQLQKLVYRMDSDGLQTATDLSDRITRIGMDRDVLEVGATIAQLMREVTDLQSWRVAQSMARTPNASGTQADLLKAIEKTYSTLERVGPDPDDVSALIPGPLPNAKPGDIWNLADGRKAVLDAAGRWRVSESASGSTQAAALQIEDDCDADD